MKTYWNTEYNAVPICLYELAKAMDYNSKLHLKPERRYPSLVGVQKYIKHFTQHSMNVDAYRYYVDDFQHSVELGVRFGNEGNQYMSYILNREVASRFNLDPLNKDKFYGDTTSS